MADFFILPSRGLEGFGLVTLEAMASGVPVLGTPVGGTPEILGKFYSNFLFKDTSADSMADLIAEKYRIIKEHPEKWAKISKRSRKFVEKHYSWDRNIDALEAVLMKKQGQF
ncbi:MAG: glycosyltransferase family 4 protein [Proteobacteria bacterium]|nr:glycosyltransferase family 4 protein [Pseudomonadota bacterium]